MHLNYEYISVAEHYRRNGWRHLENAISYASAGYPLRFYNGSMIKALRNFKRATELDNIYFYSGLTEEILRIEF